MKAAAAPRIPTVHKIIFVNFAASTRSCRVPLLELLEGTCAPASETAPPAAAATDDARLALATIRSIGRRAKFKPPNHRIRLAALRRGRIGHRASRPDMMHALQKRAPSSRLEPACRVEFQ